MAFVPGLSYFGDGGLARDIVTLEIPVKNHLALGAAVLALSAPAAFANDWSGFYIGGGIGSLEVDPSGGGDKDEDFAYGLHAGYRFDAGQWVVGGEFEHEWTDIGIGPGDISVDSLMRLKASVGYDFGQTLAYLVAGTAEVDVDGLGDEWGEFFGLGAAYAMGPQTIFSVELLEHNFSDIDGSGVDADAWSVNVRVSWKF